MYPADPVVFGYIPHGFWEVVWLGHSEAAVEHRDDVAAVLKRAGHLLVDPVLL